MLRSSSCAPFASARLRVCAFVCVCVFVSFVFFCRAPFLQCFFVYFVYFVFASLFSSYADVVVLGAAGRLLEQPDCITGPSTAESEIATQESGGAKAYALRSYPFISSNSIRRPAPKHQTGDGAPVNSSPLSLSSHRFFPFSPFYVSSSLRIPTSRLPSHWAQ